MAVYIVRPKEKTFVSPLGLGSAKFDLRSRQHQVEEVIGINQESPAQQELQDWISDAEERGVVEVLKGPLEFNVTGTSILDLPEEEADRMQKEIPDLSILPDQYIEIEIVQPYSRKQSKKISKKLEKDRLWHLQAIGIDESFLSKSGQLGQGVTIAILDTGVQASHPAFKGKKISSYKNFSGEVISEGYSVDTSDHGTHVAGLICGNGLGVAQGASVMSCIVLPERRGTLSEFISALEWVSQQPEVSIVNISAGLDEDKEKRGLQEAIDAVMLTGILPVCAAGNKGPGTLQSPAKYRPVISVGATDRHNRIANFSAGSTPKTHRDLGYPVPSLVAPGHEVLSSIPGDEYAIMDGTSMAAAIVSGVAASLLSEEPYLTIDDLKQELISRCNLLADQECQGAGIIQVKNTRI